MSKKFFTYIFLLLLLVGCGNDKKEKEIKYEDVYAIVEEYNAIFKDTTYYTNYKIDEDTGNILEYDTSYDKEGTKRRTTYKMTYDENGNVIQKTENGPYDITIRKYTYDKYNNVLTQIYKDSDDNLEELISYEYEYDENGKILTMKEKDSDGESTETYKYDVSDNYYCIYEYEYDEDGKLVIQTETSKNNIFKIVKSYDENGNLQEEKIFENKSPIEKYVNTYKYEVVGKKKIS